MPVHFAYLGDLAHAAALAPYLPPGSPRVDAYQAVVRWRERDLDGAIALLRRVAASAPQSADGPAIPPPLYLLGEALSEAGRDAEAVDALQRFRAMPVLIPSWFLPRSLYFLARSLDRLGQREKAREAIGALLHQWRRAASSQPLLAEARALGARLGVR
jgi:tetratricopeptide (TPR) repeat protein